MIILDWRWLSIIDTVMLCSNFASVATHLCLSRHQLDLFSITYNFIRGYTSEEDMNYILLPPQNMQAT